MLSCFRYTLCLNNSNPFHSNQPFLMYIYTFLNDSNPFHLSQRTSFSTCVHVLSCSSFFCCSFSSSALNWHCHPNELIFIDKTFFHVFQCCFPPHLAGHACSCRYRHADYGTAITWDDALYSSRCHFEHHTYNIFTCNCYSFVANCLNRLCYGGSMGWNMVNVAALVLIKGHWVDGFSILRSFLPCITVICFGLSMAGWHFLIALLSFSLLVFVWFVFGTYCAKNLLKW